FLARQSSSGALAVLKVFRAEDAAYAREHHAPLGRLDHPNIVRVLGGGELAGFVYYALEYAERTLADVLIHGPLPEVEAARVARALASALQHARDQGLVVLDLQPRAVLLGDKNVPKLADFRPDGAHPNVSLDSFVAPEELEGVATAATDVYRIGAVLYAM